MSLENYEDAAKDGISVGLASLSQEAHLTGDTGTEDEVEEYSVTFYV